MTERERVAFYFDPLCPWAWLTSLWIREVREHRPIDVEWKFFSLAGVNDREDKWHGPLRIAALARRTGGNDAVDRAYLALGRMFHEGEGHWEGIDNLAQEAAPYLDRVGLDPKLAAEALNDPTTLDDVMADHKEILERGGAFGVPWIVVDGDDRGFFGPVIGEFPQGDEAAELWDHFRWMGTRTYLNEIKRGGRKKMTPLAGKSARLSTPTPVGD